MFALVYVWILWCHVKWFKCSFLWHIFVIIVSDFSLLNGAALADVQLSSSKLAVICNFKYEAFHNHFVRFRQTYLICVIYYTYVHTCNIEILKLFFLEVHKIILKKYSTLFSIFNFFLFSDFNLSSLYFCFDYVFNTYMLICFYFIFSLLWYFGPISQKLFLFVFLHLSHVMID